MQVKDLSFNVTTTWPVCIPAPVQTIVGNHDELKHVVVQGECHLIERLDILVEGWNCEDIRPVLEIGSQSQISRVVTHGSCQP